MLPEVAHIGAPDHFRSDLDRADHGQQQRRGHDQAQAHQRAGGQRTKGEILKKRQSFSLAWVTIDAV
jgi:hypothetical protein